MSSEVQGINAVNSTTLRQDTRTLKLPVLQDLVNASQSYDRVFLGGHNLTGEVRGLCRRLVKGSKATYHQLWKIERNTAIEDGSIDLPNHVAVEISKGHLTLRSVTIKGNGIQGKRHEDPYLFHVLPGASLTLENCTIETTSPEAHAVLVSQGGTVTLINTTVAVAGCGCAMKVSGGTATVTKRSVLRGGVLVTAPQPNLGPEAALEQRVQACWTLSTLQPRELETPPNASSSEAATTEEETGQGHSVLHLSESQIVSGPMACLTVHGSNSRVVCEQCIIRGPASYGVCATGRCQVQMSKTDVKGTSIAAASLSGQACLEASECNFSATLIGLTVTNGATAKLHTCTLRSSQAADGNPATLPPPQRPGFLPDFTPAYAAPAQAEGTGSCIIAEDCVFGNAGVHGWREVKGGRVAAKRGVAAAMQPLNTLPVPVC